VVRANGQPVTVNAGRVFLSAEWRNLVMLNYRVDPAILKRFVPPGTEIDSFEGNTYISVVGFQFLRTRMYGAVPIPYHVNFDEVNLRFYVRRRESEELRRGVVFIKEVVPRRAIAEVARFFYGEKYAQCRMRHKIWEGPAKAAEYEWRFQNRWYAVSAAATSPPFLPSDGSMEQFITEHYGGYSVRRDGRCVEYRVSHEPWRVWRASSSAFKGDGDVLYGDGFGNYLKQPADSALIAEGSEIQVHTPRLLVEPAEPVAAGAGLARW
jgi:uncharacterized protein YqjF (DUF2071 family)